MWWQTASSPCALLPNDAEAPQFSAALMEIGATACGARAPRCGLCPSSAPARATFNAMPAPTASRRCLFGYVAWQRFSGQHCPARPVVADRCDATGSFAAYGRPNETPSDGDAGQAHPLKSAVPALLSARRVHGPAETPTFCHTIRADHRRRPADGIASVYHSAPLGSLGHTDLRQNGALHKRRVDTPATAAPPARTSSALAGCCSVHQACARKRDVTSIRGDVALTIVDFWRFAGKPASTPGCWDRAGMGFAAVAVWQSWLCSGGSGAAKECAERAEQSLRPFARMSLGRPP
jgi:hypothetical protein